MNAARRGWIRRWIPLLALGVLAGLSLLAVEVDHRMGLAGLDATVVTLDNLARVRVAVADAGMAWEAVQAGDTTYDSSAWVARLDEATGALDDLLAGRSALGTIRGNAPVEDPLLRESIQVYLGRVSAVRAEAVSVGTEADPVAQRIQLQGLASAATELERHVDRAVGRRRAAKQRRHLQVLAVWGGLSLLVLAGFAMLQSERVRAQLAGTRAERRRSAAERKYVALERLAPVGLLRVGEDGTVREASRWWARTLGLNEGNVEGKPWWSLVPEDDRPRVAGFWRERVALGVAFPQDVRMTDQGERRRWLAGRWEFASGGPAPSWVGSFVDVTEQRTAEAQFHQAQKLEAVGRLTGGLAHDFNNLLSVILTNTHLFLMDAHRLGKEEREMLDDVDRAAKSGRDLVKRLMGFSRRGELSLAETDLSGDVRQAATLARKLVPSDVELELDLPKPGPTVHADAQAVEQILLNLVSNAQDAMPDGGTIRIAVDEVEADAEFRGERPWVAPGRYGRITVSDEGTGMDEATLEQVFEPFFTTKAEGMGTGLGLATVHGLMRQHEGHVRVYSQVGKGTTFRLYFPGQAQEAASTPPAAGEEATEAGGRRGLSILLVEDDHALRRTYVRILTRLGYSVLEAAGGEEALRILDGPDGDVDVVLSDLAMPGVDGVALHRRLRERGDRRPFIFTSGLTERDVSERGMLPDNATFLAKPWAAKQLLDLMETLDLRAG